MTMLKALLGTIATQQSKPTESNMRAIVQILNYAALYPNAEVQFKASDMILWIDSDASYLSESKARSTCIGYHFLSDMPRDCTQQPQPHDAEPMHNAPIYVMCNIMKEVLSVASEAELAGLFHNGKEACPIRICLAKLGHSQPPTPLKTDNTTAEGLAIDTPVKHEGSKAIDMHFYWIRHRVCQGQYHDVYWRKAEFNRADYFTTKHHAPKHHQNTRIEYLHQSNHVRNQNYCEALNCDDCDKDYENANLEDQCASDVQIRTFDPTDYHADTCTGVPRVRVC